MVLGRLDAPGAVEPLIVSLSDPHGEVRRQAVLSLGYLGDRRAREALIKLASDDPAGQVRAAAAYAVGLLDQQD